MWILVTGVAGFIGSNLAEKLLEMGYSVKGVDCFTPYYPREYKEENISHLLNKPDFQFLEKDLSEADLSEITENVGYVFHLAAQPGVRASWSNFENYLKHNLYATYRLLEACRKNNLLRFIFASSSSIYGEAETYPTPERLSPKPISPYGITKTAAERLCEIYHSYYSMPIVILRYFTVYGPRQRPDMGIYRFIESMILGKEVVVYGDGNQQRDFTYISDIVDGTIRAMDEEVVGETINLGSGIATSINRLLELISRTLSVKPRIRFESVQPGDMMKTSADITKAVERLRYNPSTPLEVGIQRQIEWFKRCRVKA